MDTHADAHLSFRGTRQPRSQLQLQMGSKGPTGKAVSGLGPGSTGPGPPPRAGGSPVSTPQAVGGRSECVGATRKPESQARMSVLGRSLATAFRKCLLCTGPLGLPVGTHELGWVGSPQTPGPELGRGQV